jgi:hypothetical protein
MADTVNESPAVYQVPTEFWKPRFVLFAFLNDRHLVVVGILAFLGFQLFSVPGGVVGAILGFALGWEKHGIPLWRRGMLYATYLARQTVGSPVIHPETAVVLADSEGREQRDVLLTNEDGEVLVYTVR